MATANRRRKENNMMYFVENNVQECWNQEHWVPVKKGTVNPNATADELLELLMNVIGEDQKRPFRIRKVTCGGWGIYVLLDVWGVKDPVTGRMRSSDSYTITTPDNPAVWRSWDEGR